jgi:hypothetical protein
MAMNVWDERYAGEAYHFGTEPNAFLAAQKYLLKSGMSCLALADGEGRNGVWLAQQGLQVLAVDAHRRSFASRESLHRAAIARRVRRHGHPAFART